MFRASAAAGVALGLKLATSAMVVVLVTVCLVATVWLVVDYLETRTAARQGAEAYRAYQTALEAVRSE